MIAELILIPDRPDAPGSVKVCAQNVARVFSDAGINVREQVSLCSGKSDLQKGIANSLKRSNVIVIIGGLGRETGGITKQVVAHGLGLSLETVPELFDAIRAYCERSGDLLEPGDAALAQIPSGSVFFPGRMSKVPGLAISSAKQHIVMLPAYEPEALGLLGEDILPYLQGKKNAESVTVTHTIRTYSLSEEMVGKTIASVMGTANPAVTIHKESNEVLVRVTGKGASSPEAAAICTPALQRIVDLLGDSAYGLDVESLQAAVVDKLRKKQLGLAVAEAGTAGMLTRIIGETTGGADVLRYSVFAEDDAAKKERLSIPSKLLKKRGGVCERVAVHMADAIRQKSGAQLGVAITMGRGNDKRSPHGLVYIAVCNEESVYVKKLVVGSGDPSERNYVIDAALSRALNMIRLFVDYLPGRYMGSISLSDALAGKTVTDRPGYDAGGEVPEGRGGLVRRFFGNFIIKRADRPGVTVKKLVFILAVLVFLASAGYIGYWMLQSWQFRIHSVDLQSMYTYGDIDPADLPEDFPRNYQDKFAALYARNKDIIGFINFPGTEMAYPVVQSGDNDYYLRRDFYGNSTQHGIPFMDWRVDAKRPSDNMVIYGHNMKDGQLFGELMNLNTYSNSDALHYYTEHPIFDFSTVYSDGQYVIFAVFITNAYEEQGPVFNYHNFIEAKTDADFTDYVDALRTRSLIDTGIDVQPGDKLVTLSTCTYEFTDARFVVVGRKLRRNESASNLDLSGAVKNPSPLMPDIWYQIFGGNRPGDASDTNVVTSPSPTPTAALFSAATLRQVVSAAMAATDLAETESLESSPPETSAPAVMPMSTTPPESQSEPEPQPVPQSQHEPESEPEPESESEAEPEIESEVRELYEEEDRIASSSHRGSYDEIEISVLSAGETITGDALDIVSRIVQSEIGSAFHIEAIKAQAVAAYSYIAFYNQNGTSPSVVLAPSANQKVISAVEEVLGQAVYYNGRLALTPYYATSAGSSTSSKDVWGSAYKYLVPVDSEVDKTVTNYRATKSFTYDQMVGYIEKRLGFSPDGEPEDWFEILGYIDGDYVGSVSVCGQTATASGTRITGRFLRESVFGLRSACFEIDYDGRNFIFTTYGYGHGVGMSQNGANQYAKQGWDYIDILTHYYPGTEVY